MLISRVSSVLLKGAFAAAGIVGAATLGVAPASADTATGVVSYTTPNFAAVAATELSTSNVITSATLEGTVEIMTETNGADAAVTLTVVSAPNAPVLGVGTLQAEVVSTLATLGDTVATDKMALDAYVGILKAAAGADGLEDNTTYGAPESEPVVTAL